MKRLILSVFLILGAFSPPFVFSKDFNIENEVKKCQKCHGINYDEKVLNSTKKISSFSKSQLLASFEKYLNVPNGGKPGLMKIIVKKYSKKERKQIVNYIYNKSH